ncbi:MAG: hypothetical protein E7214_11705 [Clostridium sp.]|nr:hypothetical protein [Clostridium sp.]
MHILNIYNLLFYYIIYSCFGWCAEVLYAYKNQRKFVNRGFLHGPICPIYGSCVLFITMILENFKSNIFILLIIATILTSVVEYFTGLILEKLFKKKYWDYTEDPFNLHGRICLHFSLMWGGVSVLILKVVHPLIVNLVNLIPYTLKPILFISLVLILLIDLYSTLNNLINFEQFNYNVQISQMFMNRRSINIETLNLDSKFQNLKEKLNVIFKKTNYLE